MEINSASISVVVGANSNNGHVQKWRSRWMEFAPPAGESSPDDSVGDTMVVGATSNNGLL